MDKLEKKIENILLNYKTMANFEVKAWGKLRVLGSAKRAILDLFQQHKREYLEGILPERKDKPRYRTGGNNGDWFTKAGWNDCLDEIKKRGGVE